MQEIHEFGLQINRNGLVLIDTEKWTTQALLAQKLGVTRNTINNRVRRYEAAGQLTTYYIEQLGIRLIPNVMDINDLGKSQKKQ